MQEIDWQKLVFRGLESKELDYKNPCSWDEKDKKASCELVKDILAMANTKGGWLIIGVSETPSGFSPDGVSESQAKTFETTRINNFVQNYADPPINALVKKEIVEGKIFIIIVIPCFTDTPHICQKDYPGVLSKPYIYVRTANNESAPLKESADARDIVEKAIRNRSDQLLGSFRTILLHGMSQTSETSDDKYQKQIMEAANKCDQLNPHGGKAYSYNESMFYPAKFIESRYNLSQIRKMIEQASISFRGWPYIFFSEQRPDLTNAIDDGMETAIKDPNPFDGSAEFHFWQMRQSGLCYVRFMRSDVARGIKNNKTPIIDPNEIALNAIEAFVCMTRMYEGMLEDSDEIIFNFNLLGVKDKRLGTNDPLRIIPEKYVCNIETITYKKAKAFVDWRAGLIEHAMDLTKYIIQRFNWNIQGMASFKAIMEKNLQRKL